MANRFVWSGMEELKAALRSLPEDLAGDATKDVTGAANSAAVAIRTGYGAHRRSGKLQDGVTVEHSASGVAVRSVVKSSAPHAWIFENGTQARHNALGANRGSMPPGNVFIPAAVKARRSMYGQLKDLLVRHGLKVTGDA